MFHRRNLPHLYQEGATYFITFRLFGTIPTDLLKRWHYEFEESINLIPEKDTESISKLQKQFFQKFDHYLDTEPKDIKWLQQPEIAKIVMDRIESLHDIRYHLLAYCIMPNHVHLLIRHFSSDMLPISKRKDKGSPLSETMQLIKGATAKYCNEALGLTGTFWQHESYDYLVRNREEQDKILQYIVKNPVKAGIVENETDYSYTFVGDEF